MTVMKLLTQCPVEMESTTKAGAGAQRRLAVIATCREVPRPLLRRPLVQDRPRDFRGHSSRLQLRHRRRRQSGRVIVPTSHQP